MWLEVAVDVPGASGARHLPAPGVSRRCSHRRRRCALPDLRRVGVLRVMRTFSWVALGIALTTSTGVALGKGGDKGKKGRSEEAHRKGKAEHETAKARRAWIPPGLGRPIANLDDLRDTRAARREAHRNEVRDKLKGELGKPTVQKELERHARFEARLDVLETKVLEANKSELFDRIAELRRREEERHRKNLEQLAGAK